MSPEAFVTVVFCSFVAFGFGVAIGQVGAGSVKAWIDARHEYRMKLLEHRARWLDVDATRPRAGEYRHEERKS